MLQKSSALILSTAILLVAIFGIATAYPEVLFFAAPLTPAQFGHSLDEIAMPSCANGQILKMSAAGWACGTDALGTTIPVCSTGQQIRWNGTAWECFTGCAPTCDGKACGADDGCGSPCQTGTCPINQTCQAGTCVVGQCIPTCNGTNPCGSDGCGGSCGTCNAAGGWTCNAAINGSCVSACPPGTVISSSAIDATITLTCPAGCKVTRVKASGGRNSGNCATTSRNNDVILFEGARTFGTCELNGGRTHSDTGSVKFTFSGAEGLLSKWCDNCVTSQGEISETNPEHVWGERRGDPTNFVWFINAVDSFYDNDYGCATGIFCNARGAVDAWKDLTFSDSRCWNNGSFGIFSMKVHYSNTSNCTSLQNTASIKCENSSTLRTV